MKIVEYQHDIVTDIVQLVDERCKHVFRRRVCRFEEGECANTEAGHRYLEARDDVRPEQPRSLSRSSSESHATAAPLSAPVTSHSVTSIVFPNPAGAEISTNLASAALVRRACKRGRDTRLRRGDGMWSFVSTSRLAI